MRTYAKDFNHIKEWLDPKLREMNLSVEAFARLCGLTRAAVCDFRNDTHRPHEQTMIRMCQVLGVPAKEGFAQYTAKKKGRPPSEARDDLDIAITLDHLNPPAYRGRVLRWSGHSDDPTAQARVPEPGEGVRISAALASIMARISSAGAGVYCGFKSQTEFMPVGIVTGYFQAHGYLGVKVRLESTGEEISVFGAEIDVASGAVESHVVN